MRGAIRLLAIYLLCFVASPAWAQELPKEIPGLGYGNPETFAEFHGFLTLDYRDFGRDGEWGGKPTFDQSDFYFNSIAQIRQNLMVFGEVEYKHGGERFKLDRAFLEWKIAGGLTLDLGKFYAPFGLEIQGYHSPVRKLVTRPFIADDLLYNEWAEVGFKVSGGSDSLLPFTYSLAMVNGPKGLREEDLTNRNSNSEMFFVGRVALTPHRMLHLGASYGAGTYDDAREKDLRLIGIEALFRWAGLDLRGEWVRRSGDNQEIVERTIVPGAATGDPAATLVASSTLPADADGYYFQAAYPFLFNLSHLYYVEPVVRYDVRDPDRSAKNNTDQARLAIGLNLSPYPHLLFRIEYDWVRERYGTELKNDAFLAQAVADF